MSNASQLLTTAQAAERLGVPPRTVARWVQSERLSPAYRLPGATGALLFEPADIEALRLALLAEVNERRAALTTDEVA